MEKTAEISQTPALGWWRPWGTYTRFSFAIPLRFPLLLSQNLNDDDAASERAQRNQMRKEQARGNKSQEGS
jgi:hypothetical protein